MPDPGEQGELLRQEQETNLLLQETIADLELALEDKAWNRLTGDNADEFSAGGRRIISQLCRSVAVANPLIKRGLMLRIAYIWGGGVEVQARDENVQSVVTQFWDDNVKSLTGSQAQEELERALGTDGNVYLAAFTSPLTGRVRVRSTPPDEIIDVICNPDDRDEPWFYLREYIQRPLGTGTDAATGANPDSSDRVRELYPCLGYKPSQRVRSIQDIPVKWDAPMLHVAVNRLDGWTYGVPDVYASMAWARAYKDFLTDWALLTKSLAKFAWRTVSDSRTRATKAANTIRANAEANNQLPGAMIPSAGQAAALGPGTTLEAIPKSGANIDADSGKPLAAMVASGIGMPVTLLLADPGVTGARAVAETLDKPTLLEMGLRRMLWQAKIGELLDYVIDQSALAPKGTLKGTAKVDDWGRRYVELAGDADSTKRTVDWEWPDLNALDPVALITAIVSASTTELLPHEEIARLLLTALGVKDVDELLKDMQDDQGNFTPPAPPGMNAGQAAVDAFNAGKDPAQLLNPKDSGGGKPADSPSGG
jgi:hypothetical protein